ncbi:MAG TPA: hypothetical protein VGF99_09535 [Myxococcota bacterium]
MPMKDHLPATGAAVVVGAAQLVPLPLIDDWIASFSRRRLIGSILKRHGRTFAARDIKALGDDGSLLGLPFHLVKSLVLFPVKKLLRPLLPVLLARDVGLAVGRTFALAHTLDRHLRLGALRNDDDVATRADEARRLRAAFDQAWKNIDQRLVVRAVKRGVLSVQKRAPIDDAEVLGLINDLDDRVDRALAGLPRR